MRKLVVFLSTLSLLGCTATYRPKPIPLKDKHLAALPTGRGRVTVINVTEAKTVRSNLCCSGPCFFESVDTDLEYWGEAISWQLRDALERLGYTLSDSAEKGVMVRATGAALHYVFFHFKQVVSLEIELGDGNKVEIKTAKRDSNSWKPAADKMAMKAAYWIIKNESVQDYLKEQGETI